MKSPTNANTLVKKKSKPFTKKNWEENNKQEKKRKKQTKEGEKMRGKTNKNLHLLRLPSKKKTQKLTSALTLKLIPSW